MVSDQQVIQTAQIRLTQIYNSLELQYKVSLCLRVHSLLFLLYKCVYFNPDLSHILINTVDFFYLCVIM